MGKARVEALSDGVFAVAMTILIFSVEAPKVAPGHLLGALWAEWPSYAAYVGTFFTVGVVWVNHHAFFERLTRVDRPLITLNLCLLIVVVFIPFPTGLLGHYIQSGSDANTAATFYALVFVLLAIFFIALWVYALTHPGLLASGFDPNQGWRRLPRFSVGFVIYLACIPLAQVSPVAVVVGMALTAVYYLFESLPSRAG